MPMLRAVPSMTLMPASMSLTLRSGIFCSAIARTWSRVTRPAVSRLAVAEPLSIPAALRRRSGAGGVFRTNVNERSSKIVICAGITCPALSAVRSLYALVNSTMLMPWGPSAVPTGGAGVALPAGDSGVRKNGIFFATGCLLPASLHLLDLEEVEAHQRLLAQEESQDPPRFA